MAPAKKTEKMQSCLDCEKIVDKKLLEVIVVVFVCGIILKKITSGFVLIVSFVNASRSVDVDFIVTIIFVGGGGSMGL